jgi:hypothetical protein
MRVNLSYGGLVRLAKESFLKIQDHRQSSKIEISISDHLTCALGIFALKFPSLLKFDSQVRRDPASAEAANFKSLFGVEIVPDDTNMRQAIDGVSPAALRETFSTMFSTLQSGKVLEKFVFYRGSYLLAIDGTGFFSSKKIKCENCCVKNHKDGTQTYYHQILAAALIHPDLKQVIPLAPEAIQKQDGVTKNDCERNAAKRLLESIRSDHPRLDITVVEDALSSNVPHIDELKRHQMHFILGIKPGDHKNFFERLSEDALSGLVSHHSVKTTDGVTREFRFINNIFLKENVPNTAVNFFEVVETNLKGKVTKFTWVTDFLITKNNVEKLMIGGRARWRIENEVFNTLKNQGYEFEHNFGHGKDNLSTCFAMLMLLAFLIDQTSEICCRLYQQAREKMGPKYSLWEEMRVIFRRFEVENWETFFGLIAGNIRIKYTFDTC